MLIKYIKINKIYFTFIKNKNLNKFDVGFDSLFKLKKIYNQNN